MINYVVVGAPDSNGFRPLVRAGNCKDSDLDLQKQSEEEDVFMVEEDQLESLWDNGYDPESAPDQIRPCGLDTTSGRFVKSLRGVDPEKENLREKDRAREELQQTDLEIVRAAESSRELDASVTRERADARDRIAGDDLEHRRRLAVERVYAEIGRVRSGFVSTLPGQEMVYLEKQREAIALLSDPQLPEEETPFINGEVGLTADTRENVAQVFLGLAHYWKSVAAYYERLRFETLAAIDKAGSVKELEAVIEDFYDKL
jgi:hypothetical protein